MPIYTIDGNIGSGKSTVLEYMHRVHGIPIDPEPVAKWQPFLESIYTNNSSSFQFQIRVWLDRCWVQARPANTNTLPLLMERSPYFQSSVFVPANLDMGRLTVDEFAMLREMYARSSSVWVPTAHIYLRSNPDSCLGRINRRARPSEHNLDASYITRLHVLHEQAYIAAVAFGTPIVCIDVEGKTVADISTEILGAIRILSGVHV